MDVGDDLKSVGGDVLSDSAQDLAQDALNLAGRLAQEELWRRHGGPAPWDEAAEPEPERKHGVLSRTVSSAEAGIVNDAVIEEQVAKLAADQEAMRRSDWENSGPEDELDHALNAGLEKLLPWRKSK